MKKTWGRMRGKGEEAYLGDRVDVGVGVLLGDLVVLVERVCGGGGGLLLLDKADGLGARDDLVGAAIVAEGVEARDDAEGLPGVFTGVVAPDDEEGRAAARKLVPDDLLHDKEARRLALLGDLGDGGARGEARELLSRRRRHPAREGAGGGDAGARALRRRAERHQRGGGEEEGRVGSRRFVCAE